ncbi:hypothetical protein SNEBB_001723 [Seison nebaliae]|nr:hypothetical protein SNEBB_001723 [Seison nebaliae]
MGASEEQCYSANDTQCMNIVNDIQGRDISTIMKIEKSLIHKENLYNKFFRKIHADGKLTKYLPRNENAKKLCYYGTFNLEQMSKASIFPTMIVVDGELSGVKVVLIGRGQEMNCFRATSTGSKIHSFKHDDLHKCNTLITSMISGKDQSPTKAILQGIPIKVLIPIIVITALAFLLSLLTCCHLFCCSKSERDDSNQRPDRGPRPKNDRPDINQTLPNRKHPQSKKKKNGSYVQQYGKYAGMDSFYEHDGEERRRRRTHDDDDHKRDTKNRGSGSDRNRNRGSGSGRNREGGIGSDRNNGSGRDGNNGTGRGGHNGTGRDGNNGTGREGNNGTGRDGNNGTGREGNNGIGRDGNNGTGRDGNNGTGREGNNGIGRDGNNGSGQNGSKTFGRDRNNGEGSGRNEGNGSGRNGGNELSRDGNNGMGKSGGGSSRGGDKGRDPTSPGKLGSPTNGKEGEGSPHKSDNSIGKTWKEKLGFSNHDGSFNKSSKSKGGSNSKQSGRKSYGGIPTGKLGSDKNKVKAAPGERTTNMPLGDFEPIEGEPEPMVPSDGSAEDNLDQLPEEQQSPEVHTAPQSYLCCYRRQTESPNESKSDEINEPPQM